MSAPTSAPISPNSAASPRRRALIIVTSILLLVGVTYAAWYFIFGSHFEKTEDAYAAGNVIQVTPQIAGTVLAIHADDTELVQAGTPLIELDRADAKVALDQAEAQLAQTVREVRVLFANNAPLQANVAARSADLERAKSDLARRQQLAGTGAVSKEEIDHARSGVQNAEAALLAAREQLASNQALTERTSVEQHPNVQRAAARVRETYLAFSRTTLVAPVTGYVAKRSVQLGQRVAAGAPLLSIVPLNNLWVDANFKEVQLAHMRIGQNVSLHSDLYGNDVEFHGKVLGMSAGTGSAFSLLPAQNASGNWIKVVQRIPVRIALDEKELAAHPLRIGLSMQAKVDIALQNGAPVANARTAPAYQTTVFNQADKEADQRVQHIIATNLAKAKHNESK